MRPNKEMSHRARGTLLEARLRGINPKSLKPLFLAVDVSGDELFVALDEVGDAFNEGDDPYDRGAKAAGENADQQHDEAGLLVAEIKFMNSSPTSQRATKSSSPLTSTARKSGFKL